MIFSKLNKIFLLLIAILINADLAFCQKYKNGGVRCNLNGGISFFHSNKIMNDLGGIYIPLLSYNFQLSFDIPFRNKVSFFEIGINLKRFHYKSDNFIETVTNSSNGQIERKGIAYYDFLNKNIFLNIGFGNSFKVNKKIRIIPNFSLYCGALETYRKDKFVTVDSDGSTYEEYVTKGAGFIFQPGFSVSTPLHFELNRYFNIVFIPSYDYWLNFNGIPKHTGFFNLSFGINFLIRSQEELEGK